MAFSHSVTKARAVRRRERRETLWRRFVQRARCTKCLERSETNPSQRGEQGMTFFKNANFNERRTAAETAKKAELERVRALTAKINEGAAERLMARQAINAARDVRAAERDAARLAAEARAAEELAAQEAALKAEQAERDARAAEQAERDLAAAAERKAARDARYAARKARK
ncbi:DUF6481 family protein [Methylosinus trichosporium]|nr:DUF6481 family protein [Methylosinus trichosporium]